MPCDEPPRSLKYVPALVRASKGESPKSITILRKSLAEAVKNSVIYVLVDMPTTTRGFENSLYPMTVGPFVGLLTSQSDIKVVLGKIVGSALILLVACVHVRVRLCARASTHLCAHACVCMPPEKKGHVVVCRECIRS